MADHLGTISLPLNEKGLTIAMILFHLLPMNLFLEIHLLFLQMSLPPKNGRSMQYIPNIIN